VSNAEGDRLSAWVRLELNPRLLLGRPEATLATTIYPMDRQAVLDRTKLAWAIEDAQGPLSPEVTQQWRALARFIETWDRPAFPVSGEDVMAAGIPKGPPVGAALKALEALWLKGGFKASREQLLAALPHIRL
jgi:poly(A) polymerase